MSLAIPVNKGESDRSEGTVDNELGKQQPCEFNHHKTTYRLIEMCCSRLGLDARSGDLTRANHWAIQNDLGSRSYFQISPSSMNQTILKIYHVKPEDEGVFRCRVDFFDSPTRNFRVNLTIIVAPVQITFEDVLGREITGVAGPFFEGYDLTLVCVVNGGRPPPKVTWYREGKILDQHSELRNDTTGTTRNRLFINVVTVSLQDEHLRCEATSSELIQPIRRNISLEIYLKPRSVDIVTPARSMSAGKSHQLQCVTSGSVPPATIAWLLDGELLRDAVTSVAETQNSTTSLLSFRPHAGDDGKELVCRAENKRFNGAMLQVRRLLDITYPPTVTVQLESNIDPGALKEGDDVLLSCEVRANPQPDSNSIAWYHGEQLLSYKESLGILPVGQRLMLRGVVMESAGEYSCAAANNEGETRSRSIYIRVQYAPRCRQGLQSRRIGAIRHETLEIKCEVTADPKDDVKFSWTYNKSRDVLPIPGHRLINEGLVSLFRFTPGSEEDHGTLACWASNSIGRQREPCMFHIVLGKSPHPPEECTLRNGSNGGLMVHCKAGFDGDLPQHFLMEVSESPEYQDSPPHQIAGLIAMSDMGTRHRAPGPPLINLFAAEEPVFLVNNLQPGRDYELAVFAVNAKGRSDPPVIIPRVRVRSGVERLTKIDPDEEVVSTHHPMAIVLGVLIASAVLILGGIFITATLVICKRRSATSQLQQEENDASKLRQDQHPNVYSEAPAPLNPATVFSVPSHVPRGYCSVTGGAVPRVRFRTEAIDLQARKNVHSFEQNHPSLSKGINTSCNEPDLIVSRAEVILTPTPIPQSENN